MLFLHMHAIFKHRATKKQKVNKNDPEVSLRVPKKRPNGPKMAQKEPKMAARRFKNVTRIVHISFWDFKIV